MFQKSLLTILLIIAALSGLVLTGCNEDPSGIVTFTYKQVGACNWDDDGLVSGDNRAFVVFVVQKVDNRTGTQDFAFDPDNLLISGRSSNGTDMNHFDTVYKLNHTKIHPLAPTTIPKGQVIVLEGYGVALVATSATDGASEADNTPYDLTMQPSGGFGFLFTKSNESQSQWPYTPNCSNISFTTN